MKRFLIIVLTALLLLSTACGPGSIKALAASDEQETESSISLFPRFDLAFVGDTMPFYDDGKMNIFYLADQRDGKTGYHP